MISIKALLINFLLRNRHVLKGKFRKERFTMQSSIEAFRQQCEDGANRFAKVPEGVLVEKTSIENIQAEWLKPEGAPADKLILYVHGGGYVSGSCNDHRSLIAKFARRCGFNNLVYEYRLAPEHPFPAALNDSVAVYKHLIDNGFTPENILIAGESAGGGLTLALLLAIKDLKLPLPVAALAISPWTDLACTGNSYTTKNKYSLAPLDSWFVFGKHYYAQSDPRHPHISPLYGDLSGLPAIFINAGTDDELFDDGERFYQNARKAGVDATFREGKNMVHCYPLLDGMFPEATEAMDEICSFIQLKLGEIQPNN
jgi:acetyl esterase/lipase